LVEQIKVASGEKLSFKQEQIKFRGHVIEFRINAEDPEANFRPSPGLIGEYISPGGIGIRLDSHCYGGYKMPSFYDSLLGKLIVSGSTRQQAINRAKRALSEFGIEGVKTTIPLHLQILEDSIFNTGNITTKYLEDLIKRQSNNS